MFHALVNNEFPSVILNRAFFSLSSCRAGFERRVSFLAEITPPKEQILLISFRTTSIYRLPCILRHENVCPEGCVYFVTKNKRWNGIIGFSSNWIITANRFWISEFRAMEYWWKFDRYFSYLYCEPLFRWWNFYFVLKLLLSSHNILQTVSWNDIHGNDNVDARNWSLQPIELFQKENWALNLGFS